LTATAPRSVSSGFGLVDYVMSAGVLSLSSLANLARALITAKVLALALGPSGVGVLSQLLNFAALLSTVMALGLTSGVSKMVAESKPDHRAVNLVVATSAALSLASGVVTLLLLAPLSGLISMALTGSTQYASLVLIILASFPLYNLAGVLSYVLQGLADVARLTRANVATAAWTVATLVPLALAYRLAGAVISVLVGGIAQAAIFIWALYQTYRSRHWPLRELRVSRGHARSLLVYGGVMTAGGIAMWGSLLIVRTLAVRQLGEADNGIYQVAYAVSAQYITAFMTWMGAYVFPRIAAEKNMAALRILLNSSLRANLLIMVPALVLITALREPLIRVLFSDAFLPAATLLPVQVLGDFAKVIGWSFGVSLFAHGYTRGHLAAILAQSATWVLISASTISATGISAVVLGYSLSYVLWPVLMYVMARRWLQVRLDLQSAALLVLGLASLVGAILLPLPAGVAVAALVPAAVIAGRHRSILSGILGR
jgi:PST family polysaccharide transporter